ncbi:phosphoribosylanthranilate isomerase [candidate division KSB1 bacterium]|nr:phosphoribosylanthranilate isomerase [candidate division KSB1 bacterium]
MFIKICGITHIDDARLAVELGANALGFIFAPSKRQVTAKHAADIISMLPAQVEKVGVFVDESRERIIEIAETAGLSCLQLHGSESRYLCTELGKQYKVLKSVKIDPSGTVLSPTDFPVWKLLLDTHLPKLAGGTGMTFPWERLQEFDTENVIVAGGLSPDNISALINNYQPFGVDVNSGVESSPGQKDPAKLIELFRIIRAQDHH